jgi:hypothetical protein
VFFEEAEADELGGFDVGVFSVGGEVLEVRAAFVSEPVFAMVAQLNFGREHRAERFADRREVVAADPLAQFD